MMKCPVEVRCIVCHLIFCCAECRWKHETTAHDLQYDCPLCRGFQFLCDPKNLNKYFLEHLLEEHLPLFCHKCNKVFKTMEDLAQIKECVSISELLDDKKEDSHIVEEKLNYILDNDNKSEQAFEATVSVDKSSKTAVITPIVRKKYTQLVDYELSDIENDDSEIAKTPYAKLVPKTPKVKKQRAVTPHVKKLILQRQKVIEEYEESPDYTENCDDVSDATNKTTPLRNEENIDPNKEMTTPTTHLPLLAKLTQIVTTSTPTHAADGNWSLFNGQTDSPLSEIENGESPASAVNEPSKSESSTIPTNPKLKSIIITGSRIKLSSQDSLEKQVTFQDSNETSIKKKVKFAEDTVFQQEPKIKRVFRKPKRMLTPGPQRPKYCINPRFQALINRFEHSGMTMARTPKSTTVINKESEENTPASEHTNMPARAINFKEDSPIVDIANCSKESNELFRTCVDSPEQTNVNNAITALTADIAGSLQNCLSSALTTSGVETEIQFKFVITKKKVSVKRVVGDGETSEEKSSEIERVSSNKENIWSTVAKAVRTVFWGEGTNLDATTPHRSYNSSESSSASKRKIEEMSDVEQSPLNHKRQRYEGRIRGRPPLRRSKTWVSSLRSSQSAEQSCLEQKVGIDENLMNLSF